jgi:peroxiredoxin
MNRLKPIFLTVFLAFSILTMAVAALTVTAGGNIAVWVSVFAAAAQVVAYFAWIFLANVPRTSPGLVGFTVGIFLATIYSVFTSYEQQVPSAAPLLAFVVMIGWMAYTTWYSELGDRTADRIKEDKRLPKINLQTIEGKAITSDEWLGTKRLVIFYYGNWCPICMGQLAELRKFAERFAENGVKITLVSPQPEANSRQLAEKYGPLMEFVVDKDSATAKALGILHDAGVPAGLQMLGYDQDMPKPTAFILDEKGRVLYVDLPVNYRVRPRPEDMLQVVSSL